MSRATSSSVKAAVTSSLAGTFNSRKNTLASQLIAAMNGRRIHTIPQRTGASHSADFSGVASAKFLGTISPSTMCK